MKNDHVSANFNAPPHRCLNAFFEISGRAPYGAFTIAGGSGERIPSENELAGARFQGKHVATIAAKLAK